jgi:crotonobetainyl-CoA:carnitine CoA-transferase CaiB-like acyl-CoA transferase
VSAAAALHGLHVLELPGAGGAWCGRLLADLGADVIKVEPPAGDPLRSVAPFAGDVEHPDRGLPFILSHTNKRGIMLDLESGEDRRRLLDLVSKADLVIESLAPGQLEALGLGFERLREANPAIVLTSISTFGSGGPYEGYRGGDLVASAMSGLMSLQGDPGLPPCNAPLDQGLQLAGIHAALASLFALYRRTPGSTGDHVEISIREVLAHMNFPLINYDLDDYVLSRPGLRSVQGGVNVYPARDGWVHIYGRRWDRLAEWLDSPVLRNPKWSDRATRLLNWFEADEAIGAITSNRPKAEIASEAQSKGIPSSPVNTVADFAHEPHTLARQFFDTIDHPAVGPVAIPGPPYRLSLTPSGVNRPAPLLGQHTAEVLDEARDWSPYLLEGRPFRNVRVVDFSIAFAGPFATRYLAELGAEVIKIESAAAADSSETATRKAYPGGRTAQSMEINRSKRSITLDLHHPRAQELARRLVGMGDVVLDNFRPGTMRRWGLGYDDLRQVRPNIIMAEMPGFGSSGPNSGYLSLGQTLTAFSGLMHLWGYPDSPDSQHCKLAYPDWVGASCAALSILAALHHRDRTGEGQYIELAQVESTAAMIGVAYMDYFANGRVAEPIGNKHSTFCPHDVYPCRGDDAWVAIAVTTDEEWRSLVTLLGSPDWAADERLASARGRKACEDEIDRRLGEWTRKYTPHQAMRRLQRAGVAAGAVQDGEDLWLDPHLRARGFTFVLDQPFVGPIAQPGMTMRFRTTQVGGPKPAPVMGEANDYVFGELLGLSAAEISSLQEEGVIH